MSERRMLRRLRALNGPGYYPASPAPNYQDPREALEELLDYRRTILAEEHSCNEAASVIYPELEPEEGSGFPSQPADTPAPLPTREGMLSGGDR